MHSLSHVVDCLTRGLHGLTSAFIQLIGAIHSESGLLDSGTNPLITLTNAFHSV